MAKLIKNKWFKALFYTVLIALGYLLITGLNSSGMIKRYYMLMLIPIGYNIILTVSLNLTAGFLGQLPLGHAGFMAIGAYSSALFSIYMSLPPYLEFPLALIFGGLMASAFGILIGLPVLRLKGDYLAIITLGFGEIIRVILNNMNITGGAFGLKGIPKYTTIGAVYICVVITLYITTTLLRSRHGRAVLSIREDEIASEASGIPTTYYKVTAFSISAFFAGLAGGLYAHYLCILDPANFGFAKSVDFLVMVVLGGMGSVLGSVVAATGLTLLPELLRGFSEYRMVIYSLLLVIVMIFKPSGLFGKYDFSLSRILTKSDEKYTMRRNKLNGGKTK